MSKLTVSHFYFYYLTNFVLTFATLQQPTLHCQL